jgi:ferredoxin-NADP reductase
MARTLTRDAEVGGCPMHAGDRVLIPWVAANHDPAVFPSPEQIRLDRDASRHLSFGIGTHRCAGAHLARAMFREMMLQVLTRLPDYRILEDGLVSYPTRGNQTGWDAIPAVFTPGSRSVGVSTTSLGLTTPVPLTVTDVLRRADDVISVRLSHADGADLPTWTPGSHIELRLPSGRLRQYSLCGKPDDRGWEIAVLREVDGRGGSVEMHTLAEVGAAFPVRGPRNHFPLVDAPDYLFLAGGIGVTPILAMVRAVAGAGVPFRVVYGGRTRTSMAYVDDLLAVAGDRLTVLPQDEHGLPKLAELIDSAGPDTAIYCCGPAPMIAATEQLCVDRGIEDRLHVERFTAGDDLEVVFDVTSNRAFDVQLARSGLTMHVPSDKRLIEVLRDEVPALTYDCEKGYCGACETRVLAGTPEHRDSVLTDEERAAGRTMMICVSRCSSERLVLDL